MAAEATGGYPFLIQLMGYLVVCMVPPPHAQLSRSVEAEGFSSTPWCFRSTDGFFMFPPGRAPCPIGSAEAAPVEREEVFLDEADHVRVEKLRLRGYFFFQPNGGGEV